MSGDIPTLMTNVNNLAKLFWPILTPEIGLSTPAPLSSSPSSLSTSSSTTSPTSSSEILIGLDHYYLSTGSLVYSKPQTSSSTILNQENEAAKFKTWTLDPPKNNDTDF